MCVYLRVHDVAGVGVHVCLKITVCGDVATIRRCEDDWSVSQRSLMFF
jgi:hypothetical protein